MLPATVDDFDSAFAQRKVALGQRIKTLLGSGQPAAVDGSSLPIKESPLTTSIDEELAATDSDA